MSEILDELREDEEFNAPAYRDSRGYLTIGYGRMVDPAAGGGITREEAEFLLANDIKACEADLDGSLPWWRTLDPVRQRVLVNLCFNLGIRKLLRFPVTLGLIRDGAYTAAAHELLSSQPWASQVGIRAYRLFEMLRTGKPVSREDARRLMLSHEMAGMAAKESP